MWKSLLRAPKDEAWQLWFAREVASRGEPYWRALSVSPQNDAPYGRREIYADEGGEVILLSWKNDFFCLPHDHGGSNGACYLICGTFWERAWNWESGNLLPSTTQQLSAPSILSVDDGTIHDMKAMGDGMSLHVYWGGTARGMRIFDVAERRIWSVKGNHGAWLPTHKTDVVGCSPW